MNMKHPIVLLLTALFTFAYGQGQRTVEERLAILEQQHISQNCVIDNLHNKVKEQEDVIANLNNKVKELDAGMVDLHSQMSSQVAFLAFAAGGSLSVDSPITFNNVITNHGSAYDGTNTFTCPADGIYAFSVTLMGQSDGENEDALIMVDGVSTVRIHVKSENQESDIMATNFCVAFCPAGGEVYVKALNDGSIFGGAESTFSGFLIGITA